MDKSDWGVGSAIETASTLASELYYDASVLRLEIASVFANSWQYVGRSELVGRAGDYVATEVAGEPVLLMRGMDGILRALSNVCRHRASTLLEGSGNSKTVRCPYHRWTYDTAGKLLAAPQMEGSQDWEVSKLCLPSFLTAEWGPFVFVHLGKGKPSFAEMLGEIPSEIVSSGYGLEQYRFLTRTQYTVQCNWKVYVDNYLEGYHLPSVHPRLTQEMEYSEYRVDSFRYHSSQFSPLKKVVQGDTKRRYDPAVGFTKPLYYWLFPNLMLSIYPDNIHTTLVLPLGPETTLTVFDWFAPLTSPASLEEIISFSDEVQKEDMGICERVQKGLRSKHYHRGRYCPSTENGVHQFHRLWCEWMQVESL